VGLSAISVIFEKQERYRIELAFPTSKRSPVRERKDPASIALGTGADRMIYRAAT
jgi:hypothetical protein